MVFFAEVFWLIHFFCEYILLRIVFFLIGKQVSGPRLLSAAAVAGGLDMLLVLVGFSGICTYIFAYVIFPLLELFLCFGFCRWQEFAKAWILLYVSAFCMGGFLDWIFDCFRPLKEREYHLWTMLIAVYFLCAALHKMTT
ncbi:MAG: sigma-E processing peptidase SpoIIGA, partial [Lachnospiraceae bacterium]|nr:sigma-E processing peptidase SpoIIGA [Lachnospiraceae bacterium]